MVFKEDIYTAERGQCWTTYGAFNGLAKDTGAIAGFTFYFFLFQGSLVIYLYYLNKDAFGGIINRESIQVFHPFGWWWGLKCYSGFFCHYRSPCCKKDREGRMVAACRAISLPFLSCKSKREK